MKIYSVLRSNHLQSTRYVKVLEAASILDVFQKFADTIRGLDPNNEEELDVVMEQFFGQDIYGSYCWIEAVQEGLEFSTFDELRESLLEHWYTEEVEIGEGFLQLYTDDDEIDMVWYLFDEEYAAQHPEKTLIYSQYAERLPLDSDEAASTVLEGKFLDIAPAGSGKGQLYIVIVATYDSGVLDGLTGTARIDGVRLQELAAWLRNSSPECEDWGYSGQLSYLSLIAKSLPEADLRGILQAFADKPLSDLSQSNDIDDVLKMDWANIQSMNTRNDPTKTVIHLGEHLAELQINASSFENDEYYDSVILFDDIWAAAHPVLAQNLLRYGAGYEL